MNSEFEVRSAESEGLPDDLFDNPDKYDDLIPMWKSSVNLIRQYETTKPKKREKLLDQFALTYVKNPRNIGYLLDNLSLANKLRPEASINQIEDKLVEKVVRVAGKRSNLSLWKPEKIEQLIQLGITSSGKYLDVIERIKNGFFNSPQTVEEAIDLHYNTAWAMVSSQDHRVREEIFSTLCLETDSLKPTSSSVVYFGMGIFSSTDNYLSKYYAVMDAIDHVGIFLETTSSKDTVYFDSERAWKRVERIEKTVQSTPSLQKLLKLRMEELDRKNPTRLNNLAIKIGEIEEEYQPPIDTRLIGQNYLESRELIKKNLDNLNHAPWPKNVIANRNEPLRKLVFETIGPLSLKAWWERQVSSFQERGYERLTKKGIDLTEDLQLEIIAKDFDSIEQKNNLIREIRETLLSGKSVNPNRKLMVPMEEALDVARETFGFSEFFDQDKKIFFNIHRLIPEESIGKLASVLEYHRPLFSLEQTKEIFEENTTLTKDLINKFTRSIGKRGYKIIIADPSLRQLGYESINFNQEFKDQINIMVAIDGQEYEFGLSPEYQITLGKDIKKILSPQDHAWLELLTLSHLKKLMCTEEENIKEELVGGNKQFEHYRKQMVHRVEHLRRLPLGWNFSTDAFNKCLKSNLPIRNLFKINQMRTEIGWGGSQDTGVWTYVSGSEFDIDTPTAKPVKVAFATATEDMRKVIDLSAVSQEELDRLEKEILEEIEDEVS